jgi:hypothetical protein
LFLALKFRQLRLATELDAPCHGALAAITVAFADKVALELGERAIARCLDQTAVVTGEGWARSIHA